jgi:type III pantothenate kinase
LTSGASLPISLRYETPQTLGADRIANALYAATVYPGRPVICISCGTAIVIDYIADATFFGGAILPGIRLQLSSLHMGTDALPDLRDANAVQIPLLPGGSTHSCMFGGVVRGAAAAIRGIVAGYAARQPARPPVICATGGDWPVLAPLIAIECIAVPDMTLVGVACFPG